MAKSILDIIKGDKGSKDRDPLSLYAYDILNEDIKFLSTGCISLNLLYSGKVDGGVPIGHMSMISAPSQLGKSIVGYGIIRDAQKKGLNVVVIDTERAFKRDAAIAFKIDLNPDKFQIFRENGIERIESVILSLTDQMTVEERQNTLFVFDSWGTLITSKSIRDGLSGNDVIDMTEPKKKNRLANVILNTQSTFFIMNHVYDNTGGFGDPLVIPGGRRVAFNCETIVLGMSRAKDKNKTTDEIEGHIITAKTYKSRFSKCESKLQYRIKHDGGLDPYYGLLEDALLFDIVYKPKNGKYSRRFIENDKEFKENEIYCSEFWKPIFKNTNFAQLLEDKYTFSDNMLFINNDIDSPE